MLLDQKLFSNLHCQQIIDGEKLFWLALSLEETEEDGFFFFKYEDWIEKYGISEPTIARYLRHLEEYGLIKRVYRPLPAHSPYPINGGSTFLFIKVFHPETEKDMTFFGKLHRIETKTFNSKEVKEAIFKDVYNQTDSIRFKYAFCDLKENDTNSRALQNIEIGQQVVFKGHVKRNTEGRPWIVEIWNIRSSEEFYADRRN
jgi:hypothetical protein